MLAESENPSGVPSGTNRLPPAWRMPSTIRDRRRDCDQDADAAENDARMIPTRAMRKKLPNHLDNTALCWLRRIDKASCSLGPLPVWKSCAALSMTIGCHFCCHTSIY